MKPKEIINQSYKLLCKYSKLSIEWERVLFKKDHQLFQLKTAFKTESIIHTTINPFLFCSDIHNFTRQQWDKDLVITIHKDLGDNMVDLEVLGIRGLFWKNESLCIFKSTPTLYGCWVRRVKDNLYFVCQIIIREEEKVEPQKLLDRSIQLQWAVDNFQQLYDPILCRGCRQRIPSWCLECNRQECKVERFGRCKDMQCYVPTESEEQERCKKCGGEVEKIKF